MALQIVASPDGAEGGERPIPVALNGRALEPNRGIPLHLDWVDQVRVNTSAVERRAATLVARRTVKKDAQAAWLLRAIACMDLTTLSGDDTAERVRRLCAKARNPLQRHIVEGLALRMIRPTSVDPVNATLSMPGCSTSACPVFPSQVSTLSTPGGSPTSIASSANASAVSGVYRAGLITTVLPAASAGATFHANISSGKFHGITCPTTPHAVDSGNSASSNCAQPA